MSSFSAKSLVNKTGIVMSVAKSDEIGKNAHLVWCEILQELLNQAFCGEQSFSTGNPALTRCEKAWLSKIAHLVWCKVSRELLNQAFSLKKPGLVWEQSFSTEGPTKSLVNTLTRCLNQPFHIWLSPSHFEKSG